MVKRPTEKSGALLTGSSPRSGKGFFSESQLPVHTLLRCPHSPRVQSYASRSVRTLKIPHTGSHTIVWTHKNTKHNDRNGQRCDQNFPARDKEVIYIYILLLPLVLKPSSVIHFHVKSPASVATILRRMSVIVTFLCEKAE